MKKIVIVTQSLMKLGGTENASIKLGNLLGNSGNEVVYFSFYKKVIDKSIRLNMPRNVYYHFKKIFRFSGFDKFYALLDFLSRKGANKKIAKLNPDFVIYTGIKHIDFTNNSFKKILVIHFSFDYYMSETKGGLILSDNFKKIDKIVFLSEPDRLLYKSKYIKNGINDNSIVIPNSVNENDYFVSDKINKKIVFIGRIDEKQKQLSHLLKVMNELFIEKELNGWELHIYGSGADQVSLQKDISESVSKHHVFFHGKTDRVAEVLKYCDIMVMTSSFEGFPISLIEGAASGLALLSYNSAPGIKDIIINGKNGFIINKNDIREFKKCLIKMINNHDLLRDLKNESRSIFLENYTDAIIEKKWVSSLE
ncbi:glycosyltransferase [Pluralibacter gergoviae]|nr:glycosyltransferase [Pluralibacter gergoviae]ELC3016780.1 glycosyltransferase [Pluralibacter gergoviae]ELC3022299.1 glycosyltransferase [Pluralibacter gergoviae]